MQTPFQAAGDQPTAIAELAAGVLAGDRDQVLLGATGTGKTFTMAKVIEERSAPPSSLRANKTLAAQLYGNSRASSRTTRWNTSSATTTTTSPRPMCPHRHLYREGIPDQRTDRPDAPFGHPGALERDDVIIVASVSCIYGIGSVETYSAMTQDLIVGQLYDQRKVIAELVAPAVGGWRGLSARGPSGCGATAWKSGPPTWRTAPGVFFLRRRA